jgi:arylsulfatase A-like enzyme
MTGLYPHRNGLMGLAHSGWELNEDVRCLPHYLNDVGYQTHLFGLQHESGRAERLGYGRTHPSGGKALEVARLVAQFLREHAASGDRQPFCLNAGLFEPHRPYRQEGYRSDDPAEVAPLPWLPDRPGIRQDIADLNGLVRAVDEAVSLIGGALSETGLDRLTLLIFTTDHGLAMPRAKGTCYEPGLRTVLVTRLPGRFDAGRRESALLTNCDLLPTILDLAGAPPVEGLDGRSFLGLLDGGEYQPRDSVFSEMTWHDKYNPMRGVRTERYKYILNFGDRPLVFLPLDIYRGRAGEEVRDEYYASSRPQEELYDLTADPLEQHNLAQAPPYPGLLEELRARVQQWMQESDDPLLRGPVAPTPAQAERLAKGEPNDWPRAHPSDRG